MARTYLPTFEAICRRLERYMDRYDAQMYVHMTPAARLQFDAIKLAVKTYLNAIDTGVS